MRPCTGLAHIRQIGACFSGELHAGRGEACPATAPSATAPRDREVVQPAEHLLDKALIEAGKSRTPPVPEHRPACRRGSDVRLGRLGQRVPVRLLQNHHVDGTNFVLSPCAAQLPDGSIDTDATVTNDPPHVTIYELVDGNMHEGMRVDLKDARKLAQALLEAADETRPVGEHLTPTASPNRPAAPAGVTGRFFVASAIAACRTRAVLPCASGRLSPDRGTWDSSGSTADHPTYNSASLQQS